MHDYIIMHTSAITIDAFFKKGTKRELKEPFASLCEVMKKSFLIVNSISGLLSG